MAYTVVSLFPVSVDPENVVHKLKDNGFVHENINVSKYTIDGELVEEMEEDEQTKNFWDYLFGDSKWKTAYQKAGMDNNTVTVYADDLESAKRAKQVMDDLGAVDIKKYHKEKVDTSYEIDESEEARIIAKARHNLFFLGGTRTYSPTSRGKADRMDSMGSKT